MPYEETTASYHPWDRGMLLAGFIVVGMALWGVLAAPAQADGERSWRRRFLRAALVLGVLALGFAADRAIRGIGEWRDLGPKYTPKDFADAAIPALEYAAIGWIAVLAVAAAADLVSTAVAGRRSLALAGVALLSAPFLASLLPPRETTQGFLPIPPMPRSAELAHLFCLWGILVLCIVCLAAMARMARGEGDPARSEGARRFGLRAGLATLGLAVVALHIIWIHALMQRAIIGPRLTTTLWSDLYRSVAGNWVLAAASALGTGAVAMAGARRRGGGEAAP